MANLIYVNRGTSIVWSDTAGDLAMTLKNLTAGAGQVGAQKDLGAGSTPEWFTWRLTVQFDSAPDVGETVEVYISTSDGSEEDGQEGTTDAPLGASDSLKNMDLVGLLVVTSSDASHDMTASGICRIPTQYFQPVVYNNTSYNLRNTDDTSELTLTPIPSEVQ